MRQTPILGNHMLAEEGHVVHATQDAPAGGPCQPNPNGIEPSEGVDRQTLGAKLALDVRDDQWPDLIQVSL